ncbi:MAG TPA: glycoside hydrolase family 3 N-terminal domain-containing protein [Gemmatimonadales bacterium]|nr:glycoside hydrolase family 3 N-terminal domain-containing protein [Gemmatimonadales bacterium]
MSSHRLALVVLAAGLSCRPAPPAAPVPTPDPYAVLPGAAVERGVTNLILDSLLRDLTLRQKVGQLVFPWLLGSYSALDGEGLDTILAAIDSLEIGGIIVSTGTPMDVAAKLNLLQRRSALPLLIAADLEFGTGMRLQGGTAFPQPMAVGATGRELDAYQMGRVTALEARAVGIHVTFSPVADVNNNPANPIINTRSFGEDPAAVSRLVAAYVRGAGEHGLSTTAKHFPGHGDTGLDSHIAMPLTTGCWDRLDTLELEPFRAAIEAGVTAVMTAHVAVPCLDADGRPATLSSRIMTDVLRDSLHFTGIVVTDALIMGAIVAQYGPGESAVLAFQAGSDLLLMPSDLRAAVDAMVGAVEGGRVSMDRLDRSVRRLLGLKLALGLFQRRTVPLDSVPVVVGRRDFQQVADDIAARALTPVSRGPMDDFRGRRGRTAVITYADENNLTIGGELLRGLRAAGDTVSTFRLYPASGPASYDSARAVIAAMPRVLFATGVRPIAWRGHVALPDSLASVILSTGAARPTLLVSFGSPYLLSQLPGYTGGYLLAWNDVLATERAVARAVSGGAAITGLLPTTLGPGFPRGSGIMVGGQ